MNIFRDSIDNFTRSRRASYDDAQAMRDQRTRMQAGQAMASGDAPGAAAALYRGGQLEAGADVEAIQRDTEQQQYQRGRQEKADQDAEIAKRGDALIKIATALGQVPAGQRKPVLDKALPVLQQIGVPTEVIAGLTEDQLTDENLTMFSGQIREQIKGVVLAPGSELRHPITGELIAAAEDRPKYEKLGPKDVLVDPRGASGDPPSALQALVGQGVKITSGLRSPADNARVGGAKNSYHLRGRAADLVPPPGMTMAQLEQQVRALGVPFAEIINEGDHVHVAWDGSAGGRVIARGAPEPPEWTPDGRGNLINANGDRKVDPTANGGVKPQQMRKDFAALRKEFNTLDEVKNFKDVAASYKQVAALASKPNPSPADDTALTFSFMKMLDPGSVVREGEYALVGRGAGLPDQVVMGLAMVDKGKGLTPAIRQRLLGAARSVLIQRRETYDGVADQYRQLAADMGINPDQLAQKGGSWRRKSKPSATTDNRVFRGRNGTVRVLQ